ncbi:hypothetical protein ES705_33442 [subsurface metagenome]
MTRAYLRIIVHSICCAKIKNDGGLGPRTSELDGPDGHIRVQSQDDAGHGDGDSEASDDSERVQTVPSK